MLIKAILVGLVLGLCKSEWIYGFPQVGRPIVVSTLTGLFLGDPVQGVIMGSVLELMFIGSFPIGAAVSPDYTSAGAICTAFAILTGGGKAVATAVHQTLGIEGEEKLKGMGVSYCATCDGAFFRNKVTAVVGGGNVALEDAIFLSRMCKKVYLIHRRDEFRGAKILQDEVKKNDKIEILWNTIVTKIDGDEVVEGLHIQDVDNHVDKLLDVDGIFIAVGTKPASELLSGKLSTDEKGYIIAGEDGVTNIPGIFAAGDGRSKNLRQVVTAVSDGANCVYSVERYLQNA